MRISGSGHRVGTLSAVSNSDEDVPDTGWRGRRRAGKDAGDGGDTGGTATKKKKRPLWQRLLLWSGLGVVLLVGAAMLAFIIAYQSVDIPDPNEDFQTETSFVYFADGKTELGEFELQNRQNVALADVPQTTQDAVIAAEDRTFYDNAGVDVKGIVRAAWNNLQGDSTQGASTITQQYVKIAYLSTEQTYTRKAKEAILALKIQQELSKEEILQGYLNTIYFGRGAYGVQAASQAYFGVDVEKLEYDQSAFLAAVLNSPGNLDPAEGKQAKAAALERYQYVLDGMVDLGTLDQEQVDAVYDRLPKTPVADTVQRLGGPKGYILTMVEDELNAEGFSDEEISGGGLQITTTFTKEDMQGVVQSVKEQKPDGLKDLHVGVASVEPGTGAVRAIYGGPDFLGERKNAQINWATAGAQPGSSFKPFALLAGLREGYSLYDTFNGNSPYYLPTGEDVENQGDSGGGSFGYVSLLTATQESINTAYVDLTVSMEDGPQKVLDSAVLAGIPREDLADVDPVPVVPLGFANVSAIDMANAYATFAAGGERADWFTVSSVTDSSGNELYDHKVQSEQVIDPDIAADITYALQQVVSSGTGTNASTITCPAAGKTGTATGPEGEVSSSWFVGFTPKLATR